MPSSLTLLFQLPATRQQAFLQVLGQVPDPRDPRGVRHSIGAVLAVAVAAVLAGARSFTAIGEWAADCAPRLLAQLGIHGRRPTESTIRRLFARIDADLLDQLMGAWMWERTSTTNRQRVIALDGKTLRGASSAHAVTPHLVAALDHATGTVLG